MQKNYSMELIGRYNKAEIFTEIIDSESISQIYGMLNVPAFADSQIKIMPDVHYGKGCVVGFTMTLNEWVCPRIVGVDIGCGINAYKIGKIDFQCSDFDKFLRENIPSGRETHSVKRDNYFSESPELSSLISKVGLKDYQRIVKSVGTLGGGNHFIELAKNEHDEIYLVIHSGSRYLGVLVCEFHINRAKEFLRQKFSGASAFNNFEFMPRENEGAEYVQDLKITQEYASTNRRVMAQILIEGFFNKKFSKCEVIESIHNYIDFKDKVVRKGATSARKGLAVIIPMNMRDGSIIATGLGNSEWNLSAPHGAGRLFGRGDAKKLISLQEFQESMEGIFSTCIDTSTIDESPMAYKPIDEIISRIKDSVEITNVIKPIYNYKASE